MQVGIVQVVTLFTAIGDFDENFQEAKLYLIFEYLTMDLKKYIDTHRQPRIDPMLVKSWTYQLLQVARLAKQVIDP